MKATLPPAYPPGLLLNERYRVLSHDEGTPRRYHVADTNIDNAEMHVVEYPVAAVTDAQGWEALHLRLRRENDSLSRLLHPGLMFSRHMFAEKGCVYVVQRPAGAPLLREMKAAPPTLEQALQWTLQFCEMLAVLHNKRPQPLHLSSLSLDNFALHASNRLQLTGFSIDSDFTTVLEAPPQAAETWHSPHACLGVAADVWYVGCFLQQVTQYVEACPLRARVRAIVDRATDVDERRSYPSLPSLTADLRRLLALASSRARWEARHIPKPLARLAAALLICLLLLTILKVTPLVLTPLAHVQAGLAGHDLSTAWRARSAVWVEATIAPDDRVPLSAPLSAAPCLTYAARLSRTVRREVFDRATHSYHVESVRQTLMDESYSRELTLLDGNSRVRVAAGPVDLRGRGLQIASIPAQMLAAVGSPLARRLALRPGEHTVAASGEEIRIQPGDRVYVRGILLQEPGGMVLNAPAGDVLRMYKGSRREYLLLGLADLLPPLFVLAVSWIGLLSLLRWQTLYLPQMEPL